MTFGLKLKLSPALGVQPVEVPPPLGNFPRVPTRARWLDGESWIEVAGTAMAVPDTNMVVHTVMFTNLAPGADVNFQIPSGVIRSVYTTYAEDPCTTLVVHWVTNKPQLWDYTAKSLAPAIYTSFTAPLTMGPEDEFRAVQFTDSHGRPVSTPLMVKAVATHDPQVIIHSGDVATTNGGINGPSTIYTLMEQLNSMRDSRGRIVPFLPNIGNHETKHGQEGIEWRPGQGVGIKPDWDTDTRGDVEWYLCVFPTWPGMRGFGVLDFGDYASIWQLNPGIYVLLDDPLDSQVDWLEASLAERGAVPHKIASVHYNFYEWGRRAFEPYMVAGRMAFGQRLYDGGCRTCFVGHAHVMGYSVPLKDFGPLDHQVEKTPAEIGEGLELFGSGTPGTESLMIREGRNPATKWWIADSLPLIKERYNYEMPEYTGNPAYRETRDPHPDDGETCTLEEGAHYWHIALRPDGRTIAAINSLGETWVSLERPTDIG